MNEKQLMERLQQDHAHVMRTYERYLTEEGFAAKYPLEVVALTDNPSSGAAAVLSAIAKKEIGDRWEFQVMAMMNGSPQLAITAQVER